MAWVDCRKIATTASPSGTINAQAHGVSEVSSRAMTPTTTLNGATASAGTAEKSICRPGHPSLRLIAAQVSSIPTTVAATRARTRQSQVTGASRARAGSSDSTTNAVQTSTTELAALKAAFGRGSD